MHYQIFMVENNYKGCIEYIKKYYNTCIYVVIARTMHEMLVRMGRNFFTSAIRYMYTVGLLGSYVMMTNV